MFTLRATRRIIQTRSVLRLSSIKYTRMVSMMSEPRPLLADDGPLVWIDCEMTGLNFKEDKLLEIAVIITNGDLKRVHPGISYVIKTDKAVLDRYLIEFKPSCIV